MLPAHRLLTCKQRFIATVHFYPIIKAWVASCTPLEARAYCAIFFFMVATNGQSFPSKWQLRPVFSISPNMVSCMQLHIHYGVFTSLAIASSLTPSLESSAIAMIHRLGCTPFSMVPSHTRAMGPWRISKLVSLCRRYWRTSASHPWF